MPGENNFVANALEGAFQDRFSLSMNRLRGQNEFLKGKITGLQQMQAASGAARSAASVAKPGVFSLSSRTAAGGFVKGNVLWWAGEKVLSASGVTNVVSTLAGGTSAYLGRVASGLTRPSAAGLYSGVLQSAGDNMPWLGANVKRFYQPYEQAGARVSGLLGQIARGGGEVDTTQMTRLYKEALKQEKKAAGVDYEVDKMVAGKLADSNVNSEAYGALAGAMNNLASAIATLFAGGGALTGGGARYLTGDR